MNTLFKKIIALLLGIMMILSLTACGGKDKTQEENPTGGNPDNISTRDIQKALKGEWIFTGGVYKYTFDGKGNSTFTDAGGTYKGEYKLKGNWIEVYEDGKLEDDGQYNAEDGNLYMTSGEEGWYYKKGNEPIPEEPYGRKDGLRPNMDFDEGRYDMPNGGAYIAKKGKEYKPGDVSWEITPDGEYMDEFGTNAFKAVGLFRREDSPNPEKDYKGSGTLVFYDYHTGKILPLISDFAKKGKKGWYEFDFATNGGKVHLEIRMQEKHKEDKEQFTDTVSYIFEVNKPDWYDNLVLAFIPQPDSYSEKQNMDEYKYYKKDMKIDEAGFDMQNALKCFIV